jgi:GTP-binding protein
MKINQTEFIMSVFNPKDLPKDDFPQIAFAGRSNVGKSSMINCLLQKKKLAKISSQPGKTRSINFIKINNRFHFVDLPGYGYAKVSKNERESWKILIESYLLENDNLKGIVQIIDARIGITENDAEMLAFSSLSSLNPIIVATKTDKLNQREKARQWHKIETQLKDFSLNQYIKFSSKTKLGKTEVWHWIDSVILD